MKKPVNHYTDEFKLQVVQEYLSTDCSHVELLKKYKISGGSSITNWMRKFGMSIPDIPQNTIISPVPKQKEKTSKEQELENKVQQLQKQLEYEQLRVLALNTLIDVAERDLKIPIRKKPGAKQ
ncbi:MAG: transposase [Parachlamydiaceae bacterium]